MSNITGSFYTSNSNLENLIPAQADITDITQRITGITYDGITDTTVIDNNVTITTPHILTLNGLNVDSRFSSLETTLTGISYASGTDTTTIDNNVVIPAGKTLTLDGVDINSRFAALETKTTGQSYNSGTDTTTFDNNMVISAGKTLTLNGGDVDAQLTALEDKTTGISYDFTFDNTTIDNNVIIPVGKTLTLNGSNVASQISTLNTKTSGLTYIAGTDTSEFDNNLVTTKSLICAGQNVAVRFENIESRITNLTYTSGTGTTTLSNPNIVLNGLIDASGNNIQDVANLYINAGGAVFINGVPINTSALLSLNNTWTGTNNFTANSCNVATQSVPSLTTLAASCRFVQDSLDWFTSTNQIYTNSSAFQNFQATNITCATQTTADNSKKVANSEYVNSKFTQFRTDNQTIAGSITFSQPPTSTNDLLLLEKTTRMPNSRWIMANTGGEVSVGVYTEFADFWNRGFNVGSTYDNQTFTADERVYVVNTRTSGFGFLPYVVGTSSVAGHQGILQFVVPAKTGGNNCMLNWNGAGTYPIHPFNMAFFECCLCNISSNIFNFTYKIWTGMTADSGLPTPNTFFGWRYDNGFWLPCYVLAGTVTDLTAGGYPNFADPLVGRYMVLNVLFRVSGSTMDVTWSYHNTWTGENGSITATGITNALGMMGPWTAVLLGTDTIQVDIALDCWITKTYCNRG
jgi:hypothetical protein